MSTALRDRIRNAVITERAFCRFCNIRARLSRDPWRRAVVLLRGMRPIGYAGASEAARDHLRALIQANCADGRGLRPLRENKLLRAFQQSGEAAATRREFATYGQSHQVRLRYPRPGHDEGREGDLVLLKKFDAATGEKGVILVSYTEAIRRFAALFDVAALSDRYAFVLEPSWWGYEDAGFLLMVGSDAQVVVQASWERDFNFVRALQVNMEGVRLGAGQWMDAGAFKPAADGVKEYDIVMVSSWSPFKRHSELFSLLASRKAAGHPLCAVLIGYPDEWRQSDIRGLMKEYDVEDCCTIFERIPHAEVGRLVSRSRCYLLLSRREGSNRALYEALFCDTPVVVFRGHRGVNTQHVNNRTGVLFDEGTLESAVLDVLERAHEFQPRAWALEHAGYDNCTRVLNETLRNGAVASGVPWLTDITAKKNGPNPTYLSREDRSAFDAEYESLAAFLLPVD